MSGINIQELASHVKDTNFFHLPFVNSVEIPDFLTKLGISKFVLIEMGVAALMLAIFVPMAAKLKGGQPAKGRFWNLIEVFLFYMRDQVIVPSIGKKDAAPYVPYLWTLFFFVLFCNLGGMIPGLGSPTGSVVVTFTLALMTLIIVIGTGMKKHGFLGFWLGMVPSIEGKVGPIRLSAILSPFLFVLEVFSFFVKHFSLCIRLMANMFGGHLMLAVFLAFIPMSAWAVYIWVPVTFCSVTASICVSFLELLIAFVQAYVFTFLTSVYIGMSIHQH